MTPDYAEDLRQTIRRAAEKLKAIADDEAGRPLAPGKWSAKQIIGHLIDSASNNHQRFVRAQLQNHLRFQGYHQDDWVSVQHYDREDWHCLIALWKSFNEHISHVMENVPREIALRTQTEHNLDEIAWEIVPHGKPVTLGYMMRDYIGHLKHHLRQIDPALADLPEPLSPNARFKSTSPSRFIPSNKA